MAEKVSLVDGRPLVCPVCGDSFTWPPVLSRHFNRHHPGETLPRRVCSIDGCDRVHSGHGLCDAHLQRVRKGGDVRADVPLRHRSPEEWTTADRFWFFVSMPDGLSGCWTWTGAISAYGYAVLKTEPGVTSFVHRWALGYFRNEVPRDRDADHVCHNEDRTCPGGVTCPHRRCVNPDHLRAATRSENVSAGRRHDPAVAA